MLINELSKKTGLSVHTIRFYEKSGLIKGTRKTEITTNNYYHYDDETIDRLEMIRDAKSIGFTISEIAQLIDAWYGNQMTLSEKLNVLDTKLNSIEFKIQQLTEMKTLISRFRKSVESEEC